MGSKIEALRKIGFNSLDVDATHLQEGVMSLMLVRNLLRVWRLSDLGR